MKVNSVVIVVCAVIALAGEVLQRSAAPAGNQQDRAADLAASRETPRPPSERELQVVAGVVAGKTNAEIAAELRVSEKTIETHLHRLFDRYGVMSRTELAVLAMQERWAPTGPG